MNIPPHSVESESLDNPTKHFLKDTDSDSDVLLILNEGCIPMAMATTQVFKRHIYFRSYLEE